MGPHNVQYRLWCPHLRDGAHFVQYRITSLTPLTPEVSGTEAQWDSGSRFGQGWPDGRCAPQVPYFSGYLGEAIRWARAVFRAKVDRFVARAQWVNLRIVGMGARWTELRTSIPGGIFFGHTSNDKACV